MKNTPSKFIPNCIEDFVGAGDFGAATAAQNIQALVEQAVSNDRESMAILLNGRPGIGKSAIGRWLIYDLIKCSKFSVHRLNGTQINLERVEEIANNLPYPDMYSDYTAYWFEECDKMSLNAQVRMLTLLDDMNDAKGKILFCTSNCALKDFEPRFSSRFTVFELHPPASKEIESLLTRWLKDPLAIKHIAQLANGCVRQALKDADLQFAAECAA